MENKQLPSDFKIVKWYADVIDKNSSNLAIFYWGELWWSKLHLSFSNLLVFLNYQKLQSWASFLRSQAPLFTPKSLKVSKNQLLDYAEWECVSERIEKILFQNEQGYILWECVFPKANATLSAKEKSLFFEGLGYVERLTFTIKPWQMPIKVLHWGRFVSAANTLIWIKWEGVYPLNLLYHNSQEVSNAYINENEIIFGDYHLDLTEKYTLRKGSLTNTVFRKFVWLQKMFPQGILNLYEVKWQTKAILKQHDEIIDQADVVHEKVEWI